MAYQPQFVPPGVPTGQAPYAGRPAGPPPYPGYAMPPATYVVPAPARPQRPAVIGISTSMTVTATTLWACALATAWLFAFAGQRGLQANQDFDGQVLILLNRFSNRLLDGLAIPLFGLPLVAFIAAFALLSARRAAQIFYTLLGVAMVGWLVWWLHHSWAWAIAPIAYVVISVAIVWTPGAVRWFGRRA